MMIISLLIEFTNEAKVSVPLYVSQNAEHANLQIDAAVSKIEKAMKSPQMGEALNMLCVRTVSVMGKEVREASPIVVPSVLIPGIG